MSTLQRRRMMMAQGVTYDGIPLMITNVGDENSVIILIPYGSFNAQIYYKQDNAKFYKKWNYDAITLQPNSTLSLFGDSDVFSSSSSNYANFSITGSSVKLSGRLASISHTSGVAYTYYKLFQNCTSVVDVSSDFLEGVYIPTTGYSGDSILSYLFSNTGITHVPEGFFDFRQPPTHIYACLRVYAHMFEDCKSLVSVPQNLFVKEIRICQMQYEGMFSGCSSLTQAPNIYATNAPWWAYGEMFKDCVSLENPPQIACNGYSGDGAFTSMFQGCTSLKQSPTMNDLIKDGSESQQHTNMFNGCSSLNYVKVSFTQWKIYYSGNNRLYLHTKGWLSNVSPTGTFICPKELGQALEGYYQSDGTWVEPTINRGESTVPVGWYIDYPIIDARDGDANAMALMAVISQQTHADGTPWVKDSLVMMKSEAEKVEDIGQAFRNNDSIRNFNAFSYFISVTNIPSYALNGMRYLSAIKFPTSLSKINSNVLDSCINLTKIDLPDSLQQIGYRAFRATAIASLYIPDNVSFIDGGIIAHCKNVTSLTVSPSNTKYYSGEYNAIIEKDTHKLIMGCNTSTIPSDTKVIGRGAFNGIPITKITLPEELEEIETMAFAEFQGEELIIPSSVNIIGSQALWGTKLTSLILPDGLVRMEGNLVANSANLTSITIPASVTFIGNGCMANCKKLTTINFGGTMSQWKSMQTGFNWNNNVPTDCVVYCTDGNLNITE